jgi:Caspase domain
MGRYYIATGTAKYAAKSAVSQLPGVEGDLRELLKSLDALGYKNALPDLYTNPTFDQLLDIGSWFQSSDRLPKDEVIFYYSGHGSVDDRHYILLASGQKFPTEDIFRAIAEKPIARNVLIVLDTCQSGTLGVDIGRIFTPYEERLEQAQAYIRF